MITEKTELMESLQTEDDVINEVTKMVKILAQSEEFGGGIGGDEIKAAMERVNDISCMWRDVVEESSPRFSEALEVVDDMCFLWGGLFGFESGRRMRDHAVSEVIRIQEKWLGHSSLGELEFEKLSEATGISTILKSDIRSQVGMLQVSANYLLEKLDEAVDACEKRGMGRDLDHAPIGKKVEILSIIAKINRFKIHQ